MSRRGKPRRSSPSLRTRRDATDRPAPGEPGRARVSNQNNNNKKEKQQPKACLFPTPPPKKKLPAYQTKTRAYCVVLRRSPPARDGAVGAERRKTPLSHGDQWRRRVACNARADWMKASAGDKTRIATGCAAGAIPKTYVSSRLQTAWTFSRVFLHNGAGPAAVHIIARDYLPLVTHTSRELRLTGSLKCETQQNAAMLLKHFAV